MGAALGLLLVGSMFVAQWAAGWLAVVGVAAPAAAAAALVGGAVRALVVAALEETIFRGLLLGLLQRPLGTPVAVGVSSLAFALVHAWNANATPLAVANLVVAGALFAVAYLVGRGAASPLRLDQLSSLPLGELASRVARGLALPIGLHAAWNWLEGSVFGFPVSGSTRESLLAVTVSGPEWATGGAFGPEGGLVGLGAMVLTGLVLWGLRRRLSGWPRSG
jgi:membrane protease YdiL (CAAX protease family)